MEEKFEDQIPDNLKELYTTAKELYERNPKDYKALFNLTVLKLQFFDYNPYDVAKDLELLYKKLPDKRIITAFYLLKVYSYIGNTDLAIKYGEEALKLPEVLLPEAYFSLAQNYLLKGIDYYEKVIDLCDKALKIDIEDSVLFQFQLIKLETYIEWNKEAEYNKLLNEVYLIYGNKKELLYDKIHALVTFSKDKTDRSDSIKELLEYYDENPDDLIVALGVVAIYSIDKQYDKALAILDKYDDPTMPDFLEIVKEKIRIYHEMGDFKKIEEVGNYYLDIVNDKEALTFILFNIFTSDPKNLDNLTVASKYLMKIAEKDRSKETFNTVALILIKIGKYQQLADYAFEYIKENPNVLEAHYIMGKFGYFVGLSYDECEMHLLKAFQGGMINEEVFLFDVLSVTKNIESYKKLIHKILKTNIKKISNDSKVSIGTMYTTGLFTKQNLNKAYKYLKLANASIIKEHNGLFPDADISCIHLNRVDELSLGNPKEIFDNYVKAYILNRFDIAEKGLAAAFMAHCYINGIGVEKNVKEAAKCVLEIMEENPYANGNIIYLYAYLYLIGEIDVDGNDVLKYLKNTYSFSRYDLSQRMLLEQVAKKLNVNIDFEFTIDEILKYDSSLAVKHYHLHKDDDVFYPFLS